jgi:magnesium transporter
LNLITGFFGMNFEHFDFIHLEHGLAATLLMMAAVGVGLLLFFWRKRYLGSSH